MRTMSFVAKRTMQLFLHTMCSARTLYSHLHATKMSICTAIVVTDANKERYTVQEPQRLIKRDRTPENPSNSMLRVSSTFKPCSVVALLILHGSDFLEACPKPWACSV